MENISVKELATRLLVSVTGLILVLGAVFYIAEMYVQNNVPESLSNTLMTIVIVITSVILVRLSRMGFDHLNKSTDRMNPHQKEVSYRFIQISVYLTAIFLIVTVWQIDLSNILRSPRYTSRSGSKTSVKFSSFGHHNHDLKHVQSR